MNLGEKEKESPDPFKFDSSEDESSKTINEKIKVSRYHIPPRQTPLISVLHLI